MDGRVFQLFFVVEDWLGYYYFAFRLTTCPSRRDKDEYNKQSFPFSLWPDLNKGRPACYGSRQLGSVRANLLSRLLLVPFVRAKIAVRLSGRGAQAHHTNRSLAICPFSILFVRIKIAVQCHAPIRTGLRVPRRDVVWIGYE